MKIKIKIDVTKIKKEKLFVGKKGTYLDAILIATQGNQYGDDFFIVQELGKNEKGEWEKGPILGNGRILGGKTASNPDAARYNTDGTPANDNTPEEVPF